MTTSKNKPFPSSLLWLFTVGATGIVCVVLYALVVVPMQLDRDCASHTDDLCMAAMDPEGIGYHKASPVLALLDSLSVLLPVSYLWYELLVCCPRDNW